MQDNEDIEGVTYDPAPHANSHSSLDEYPVTVRPGSLVGQFMGLLVPWSLRKYPGKRIATSEVLGIPPSVVRLYGRAGGNADLTGPVARRAEKICRDLISRLSVLADQFRDHALVCEAKRAPKRRGFLSVQVRDESGIPRNAQGHGRKNGQIPAEKYQRHQKIEPF